MFFPHEQIRKGQDELLKDVQQAIEEKTNLVVHAPTGLGKTAATLAPAITYAKDHGKTVLFLTSRHMQHKIALDTVREISRMTDVSVASIIGKKWMCAISGAAGLRSGEFHDYCRAMREDKKCEFYENTYESTKLTVPSKKTLDEIKRSKRFESEHIVTVASQNTVCPYEISIAMAKQADVIITDYYYLFHPKIRASFLSKIEKELEDCVIIVDEGHNLPERIRNLATESLSTYVLSRAMKEAKQFSFETLIDVIEKLERQLDGLSVSLQPGKERLVSRDGFLKALEGHDLDVLLDNLQDAADVVRESQQASFLGGLAAFLESWRGPDFGFARILSMEHNPSGPMLRLSYKCLDPSVYSEGVIEGSHATILMSGTLTPTTMYRDLLGFPEGTKERVYESPFKNENRKTLVIPHTTTKYSMRSPEMFKEIGRVCGEIADSIPGNSIIFFPSYWMRDQVYAHFATKKTVLLEQPRMAKDEKTDLLDRFKSYKGTGAVMLATFSGNFGEGVDLPGDLLKGVIMVGLPLHSPNLETKELIKYYDAKFGKGWDYGYLFPAFNRALQSAGRCIRTEQDRGVIAYLDERYAWPNYFRCFPEDVDLDITKDPITEIDDFFSQGQNDLVFRQDQS